MAEVIGYFTLIQGAINLTMSQNLQHNAGNGLKALHFFTTKNEPKRTARHLTSRVY